MAPPTLRGQQLFFATRLDLQPGLQMIETEWDVEYQLHELRGDCNFVVFASLLDAPGLGISKTGQHMSDDGYLVYPRDARPRIRTIRQRRGALKYGLELSPEVVLFQPGGVHLATGALVSGRVGHGQGASDDGIALYRCFSQTVLRGFHSVGDYWLGPEAYSALQAGKRLATIGIRSSRAYDLS